MRNLLIISANPLTQTYSNGKTLEAMIGRWDSGHVAQIYCSAGVPDSRICERFYRITDGDVLHRIRSGEQLGGEVTNAEHTDALQIENRLRARIKGIPAARLAREWLWNVRWEKNRKLNDWMDRFQPEVILFLGGDLVFMYGLSRYVQKRYQIPVIFQVTDDYLDRSCGGSLCAGVLRHRIRDSFREMLEHSSGFLTIGEYMQQVYWEKFHRKSEIFMNAVEIPQIVPRAASKTDDVRLLYAGSLYFGREKVLMAIRDSLERLRGEGLTGKLEIYTSSSIPEQSERRLNDGVISEMKGYIPSDQLNRKMEESDVLVFVENFAKKDISKTRLSVSTKLPEYMLSGTCVLAVGPDSVGSMRYAEKFACVCNSLQPEQLDRQLRKLITDPDYRQQLQQEAFALAAENHDREKNAKRFMKIVEEVCANAQ